ncbi:hypothetical protein Tco_0018925 [Tanacetum coccineum]
MTETMEQYMSKTRGDYGSGITRPTINQDTHFELKRQFLKELRDNTFSGSKHEDANEHIEKVLEIVDLFHIPKKWHNGTSSRTISWMRTMQGTTLCKGLSTKGRMKNLRRNLLYTVRYTYQPGGQYRAAGPGFYQRNNGNSLLTDRGPSLEESLTKFIAESAKRHEENSNIIKEIRVSTNAAIRNQGASIKTLEIQIGQMSKVLQERRFRSLELEQERTAVMFRALWRPVLALEAWAGHVDTRMADMSLAGYDDHRLIHDMLVQQAALQRELQEMRGHVTALEQERDLVGEIQATKDGVIRILPPVTAAEIQAVEKERKAKNILLMAIPKEHMRRFHGMDDAKEIWEAIRTRFGGNANSKKMQKAVFKQQFEAFTISSSEGLEKGYDRFQQLLSQLEAHGAEVSTEDANHKFLRSLPPAWSNLAMTMRTKPDVDTLSIDDLYNNLRVFEQEIQGASKTSSSAQNVAFVSQSKSSTNKVKSGFTGAYSTCTPSTSLTNIPKKEARAGFADEVIYSLFAKQSEDWDLLHEDLEQIDDLDIKEMDINWQIAIIAIRMKKFYKKTGR